MTAEGWRELVIEAVAIGGERLDLLVRLLEEQDLAKERLRQAGFGCIGMPWLNVVAEVQNHVTIEGLKQLFLEHPNPHAD